MTIEKEVQGLIDEGFKAYRRIYDNKTDSFTEVEEKNVNTFYIGANFNKTKSGGLLLIFYKDNLIYELCLVDDKPELKAYIKR